MSLSSTYFAFSPISKAAHRFISKPHDQRSVDKQTSRFKDNHPFSI